jgi:hypothetical protein
MTCKWFGLPGLRISIRRQGLILSLTVAYNFPCQISPVWRDFLLRSLGLFFEVSHNFYRNFEIFACYSHYSFAKLEILMFRFLLVL